jgi:Arylsulfotransferase (ASST)
MKDGTRTDSLATPSWEAIAKNGYHAILILSIAFLAFLAGSFTMYMEQFPSKYLSDAYRGGLALWDQRTHLDDPYPSEFWQPERTEARGVTIYDRERAYDGLTLYTSGHAQKALLISMAGEVVHEWSLPFSEIWDESTGRGEPRPDRYIFWHKAHLYPNGDLLAVYEAVGDTPYGYGLAKMDKSSRPIWTYMGRAHHDVDVGEDGRVYVLTQEITQGVIEGFEHLKAPRLDDFVVVLSPDGEELKKIPLLQAFTDSPYQRMLNTVPWFANGDYLHTNTVDVISAEQAAQFPFASQGQVLLSMRDIGAIAVLDLDREEIVWALQGSWIGQHDPEILTNGNLLLFDNYGHYGNGGTSRVIEFDPKTMQLVWSYTGSEEHPFESAIRSGQQRLPNGDTLITESDGGRLLEVTQGGEIVWEYLNPERRSHSDPKRRGENSELIAVVSGGQRIDPASLDPNFLPN